MLDWNKYPYTDFHELNQDFILKLIKDMNVQLDEIEERATQAAISGAQAYVDNRLVPVNLRLESLQNGINTLRSYIDSKVLELDNEYTEFTQQVISNLNIMQTRISTIQENIDISITAVNDRTDLRIRQNNDYIFSQFGEYVGRTVKVINPITGERMTLQNMFAYLAGLHVTDAITVNDLIDRDITVSELAALNITASDMVLHGNTLIPE